MEKTRVLIVDDHPVFRFGLSSLISSIPEMEVVGEAASGEEAIREAAHKMPDIILMDINMPGLNGIAATRQILKNNPEVGILVISMFDDDSVFDAMQAGARGYILKGADPEDTVRALHAVASGEAIFSPRVAERLVNYLGRGKTETTSDTFPELTGREGEVLELIAQGLTNQAIAERLVISQKTVRNHVSEIYSKLQVTSRGEAVARARDAGLGE